MTLKSSSRKQFINMFLRSLPVASIFPGIFLTDRLIHSFSHSAVKDYYPSKIGFFWSEPGSFIGDLIYDGFIYIIPAFLTALLLFSFAWKKNRCNVIFALGMKKSEIYISRILAGIVPFVIAVFLAASFEVFACAAVGYRLTPRYFGAVFHLIFTVITPYIMTFSIFSVVLANVGSVIEGSVFSFIIMGITNNFGTLLSNLFKGYTLGAPIYENLTDKNWVWSDLLFFNDSYLLYFGDVSYFLKDSVLKITLYDWSSIISGLIYTAIAIFIGVYAFKKRKNEISGTFGRAKAFNEVAAATFALYMFNLFFDSNDFNIPEKNSLFDLITGCIAFFIAYILFKLIFGYKRKKEFVHSLKRTPVYIIGFCVCALVFHLGLFGYSSKIPSKENLLRVEVSTPLFAYLDDSLADMTYYGMKPLNIRDVLSHNMTYSDDTYYYDDFSMSCSDLNIYNPHTAYFKSDEEIERVMKVHRSFVDAGHIKCNANDTCGTKIRFCYVLESGERITRDYFCANEEITKAILTLSDSKAVKEQQQFFLTNYLGQFTGYNEDPKDEGYLEYEPNDKFSFIFTAPCYLFSKDMKNGYSIGTTPQELLDAIAADVSAQRSEDYYYHNSEDEIGIISFGDTDKKQDYYFSGSLSEYFNNTEFNTSATWNLNSLGIKAFVLTKDMKNTIKFLEENGLMKHFEVSRSTDDIAYVKVSRMNELYSKEKSCRNIPLFYGAHSYNDSNQMYEFTDEYTQWDSDSNYYPGAYAEEDYFLKISSIKDKVKIRALLDDSVIFGYCSNGSYIMKIVYTDNTVSTVLIPEGSGSLKLLN